MRGPIPLGVLADAGTHPLDVDSDATGVRYSREEPAPVKTRAGIHPDPPRSNCAESMALRITSSLRMHAMSDTFRAFPALSSL